MCTTTGRARQVRPVRGAGHLHRPCQWTPGAGDAAPAGACVLLRQALLGGLPDAVDQQSLCAVRAEVAVLDDRLDR
ncbi:hypothetical protein ACWD95_04855, partial [Streptomyces sp. NPDC005069]